jgi:hypothetical protein
MRVYEPRDNGRPLASGCLELENNIPSPRSSLGEYRSAAAIYWNALCLRLGGPHRLGRWMTRLARLVPLPYHPYYSGHTIAGLVRRGYFSPRAVLVDARLTMGDYVFVGDDVRICEMDRGGPLSLGDCVVIERGGELSTGHGGSLRIGPHTFLGRSTSAAALVAEIDIGAPTSSSRETARSSPLTMASAAVR